MKIVEAEYKPFPVAAFQGNPLVEALRPAIDIRSFTKKLSHRPLFTDSAHTKLDEFSRELAIELIDLTYIVPVELHTMYKTILKNILTGYLHRNPTTRDMKYEQHKASLETEYHFPAIINLSKCISALGDSGTGKTTSIRHCFSLIPQVIRHTHYQGKPLLVDQIVHLEFQAPVTKTTRGFVLSFFLAVDQLIGTDYYNQWKGKSISVPILIQEAKKVGLNHHIGMAFIDEIQRCASVDTKADFATLEFIDDFFNSVGIPLIVAGTFKAKPLFETTMSTTRRLSSSRIFKIEILQNDLANLKGGGMSFWSIYMDNFYYPQLLNSSFEFDIALKEKVYELTVGLPALVTRLMRLAYEYAIESGQEALTAELLDDVYLDQFELMHPAITALREGHSGGFEDLLPSNVFKSKEEQLVEQVISKDIAYHERLAKKNNPDDDELFVELPEVDQHYIPQGDLRNLKGLSTDELLETLGTS